MHSISQMISSFVSSETVLAAILGAAVALVGRWLIDAIQRRFDEQINVYAKKMLKTHEESNPDHQLTLLIENTASVSALVRSIEISSPPDIKAMIYIPVVGEYFETAEMPLNLAISPYSVAEAEIDLRTPMETRSKMYSQTIKGKITYVIRGKSRLKQFVLPAEDIRGRWDELDSQPTEP